MSQPLLESYDSGASAAPTAEAEKVSLALNNDGLEMHTAADVVSSPLHQQRSQVTSSSGASPRKKSTSSSGKTTSKTVTDTGSTVIRPGGDPMAFPQDPNPSPGSIPMPELMFPKGPVKEAMSPSVAESVRSVFAAFVWHEGIVHDAMAVASYLKFHPSLSKEGSLAAAAAAASASATTTPKDGKIDEKGIMSNGAAGDASASPVKKREELRQQRHSLEVTSTPYLKEKMQAVDPQLTAYGQGGTAAAAVAASNMGTNANANRNLAAMQQAVKEGIPVSSPTLRSSAMAQNLFMQRHLMQIRDSSLPYTMRLLVMLWEEIRSYCRQAILEQVILACPLQVGSLRRGDHKRSERDRKGKKVKRKSSSHHSSGFGRRGDVMTAPAWPAIPLKPGDDPRAAAAAVMALPGQKDAFYQLCDMCGHFFQHPVTYHMRLAHPGCGKPAGGKGYNSGGNYCGGWAGNCGDGGVGGSSWYLICEKCREEHLKNAVAAPPPPASMLKSSGGKKSGGGKSPSADMDAVSKYVSGKINAAMASAFQSKSLRRRGGGGSSGASMMIPSSRLASPTGQLSSHLIMHNNAMFLLDLASASNSNLVPPFVRQRSAPAAASSAFPSSSASAARGGGISRQQSSHLSAVSELSHFDPNPFPLVPFQCFRSLGVRSSHLKMINDELVLEEALKQQGTRGGEEEGGGGVKERVVAEIHAHQDDQDNNKISPPEQFQTRDLAAEASSLKAAPPVEEEKFDGSETGSASSSPQKKASEEGSPSKRPFGRSISVGSGPGARNPSSAWNSHPEGEFSDAAGDREGAKEARNRKRNSSYVDSNSKILQNEGGGGGGGASSQDFLSKPSPALQKLFSPSSHMMMADILQRPVMSFVLQWNDLESLQVAMTAALRKAACRTFAMQALTWLLRSVSQPACLHDLLWFFVAALEAKNEPATSEGGGSGFSFGSGAEGGGSKDKKNKKNAEAAANQQGAGEKDGALPGNERAAAAPSKEKQELCEHPTSDIFIAGEAINPLPDTFHGLLQTISDLMLLLPVGSSLQQIAIRCWGIKFKPADHQFLHQSHVFSTISRILSRSEELDNTDVAAGAAAPTQASAPAALDFCESGISVERTTDVTQGSDIKVSSRQAMIASLTDNSTETFWESSDEDRNKTKWVSATLPGGANSQHVFRSVCVHVDNGRDLGNKVSSVTFKSGRNVEECVTVKQVDVESRFAGWVSCFMNSPDHHVVKMELKGPDNTLRVRQVKVLAGPREPHAPALPYQAEDCSIQQANCETETLRVFRLITGQVFGRLLEESHHENEEVMAAAAAAAAAGGGAGEEWAQENYLKEHMVGILFSRSKLTHLQKQVCSHIVQAIKKETAKFRDDWEVSLCSGTQGAAVAAGVEIPSTPDTYCFEMLSLVLALSGSTVGRTYLAQQFGLVRDLLSLLHTGSGRIQRQVISLLRRVLPKVPPRTLGSILGVSALPPKDFGILAAASRSSSLTTSEQEKSEDSQPNLDVLRPGILDVFLSCIAKALTLQVKSKGGKGGSSKSVSTVSLASSIHPRGESVGDCWWLRGSIGKKMAEEIVALLKDMTAGKLSEDWSHVAKSAIAENIINLTRLDESRRDSAECMKHPVMWLALASLCVLDKDHVEGLSSGEWNGGAAAAAGGEGGGGPTPRPTCENHDDGETAAIIMCDVCGNLCGDCDRFLHLHRRTKEHQRQVFKEEEDAIKVDLHEGCGRTKLYWVMALADSLTLKAMVEFREGGGGGRGSAAGMAGAGGGPGRVLKQASSSPTTCRFCGRQSSSDVPVMDSLCNDSECAEHAKIACEKVLPCGHFCGGIRGESSCMPCLHGCSGASLKQDADDMCMICFTEALSPIPSVLLSCGHIFHYSCCATVLEKRWIGPRITFGFRNCPICKTEIRHEALRHLLDPIDALHEDVRKKALMRLEYEGLSRCEAVSAPGARFHNDPAAFALERYAYYVCARCGKAYYGGEAQCEADAGDGARADPDDYDPAELVCGGCSDVSRAQMCPKHGTDYLVR